MIKTFNICIAIFLMLLSENALAVSLHDKTNLLMEKIFAVMPVQWRMEVVDNPKKPWWMKYQDSEFIEIRLIGPERTGSRYQFESGETKDILFANEVIILRVMPSDYDDGWTLWRRFREHLKVEYSAPPIVFVTTSSLKVYAEFTFLILSGGPPPTPRDSVYLQQIYEKSSEGSWHYWKRDVAKALKK